jgi:hypothetical protein
MVFSNEGRPVDGYGKRGRVYQRRRVISAGDMGSVINPGFTRVKERIFINVAALRDWRVGDIIR